MVERGLRVMAMGKIKLAVVLVVAMGLITVGAAAVAHQVLTVPWPEPQQQAGPSLPPEDVKQARTDRFGDPLPDGALARMGTVRLRHEHLMGALFSPDGKLIVTNGTNGFRLWDARTGKLVRTIPENFGFGFGRFRFSPDGKWLAATQPDDSVHLLETDTGRLLRRIPGPCDLLAVSPDARLLATADLRLLPTGREGTGDLTLWDTATGKPARRLEGGHDQWGIDAAFTRDGRSLVTLGFDRKLCRWEVATGKLQNAVTLQLPRGRGFRLSADARTLAVVSDSGEAVQLWDTETGKERCKLQGEQPGRGRRRLAFTPDGRTVVTGWAEWWANEGTISLWDAGTGKLLRRFAIPSRALDDLHLALDSRTLLSSGSPLVYLWDTTTGRRLLQQPAHEGGIQFLGFTPDGGTLVSGSDDGTLRLWETATSRQRAVLTGHRWLVRAVAVLPSGQAALSCGFDGTLRLWDLSTGKELRRLTIEEKPEALPEPGYAVYCLGLAADGSTAASFSYGSRRTPAALLHVWDLATGKALVRRSAETLYQNLEVLQFSPDLKAYVTVVGPVVQPHESAEHADPRPGTSRVVLKDVATGRELLALPQPDHCSSLPTVFSPDGRLLVTVTSRWLREGKESHNDRHTLHFWELATGKERLTIQGPESGNQHRFVKLAFSPDGRTLATTRGDRTIQLWDVATGKEILRRPGGDATVYCLAFTADGKFLASGHADSTILLWDLTPTSPPARPSARAEAKDLDAWWADLASAEARKVHAAVWSLIAVPQQAVPRLATLLTPASSAPAATLRQLLEDLDSDEFARREAAARKLADLEERAFPALREALRANPSAEKRRQIEALLSAPSVVRSPATVRGLRAIEVLEQIGTPEAKEVLQRLSRGTPEARLAQEAKATLERLARRPAVKP
jgi:WD40 repeat protein